MNEPLTDTVSVELLKKQLPEAPLLRGEPSAVVPDDDELIPSFIEVINKLEKDKQLEKTNNDIVEIIKDLTEINDKHEIVNNKIKTFLSNM